MSRHRRRRAALSRPLLLVLIAAVLAGIVDTTPVRRAAAPLPVASRPAGLPAPSASPTASAAERAEAAEGVRELLEQRSAALLARNRAAFLATVSPQSAAFARRQAALFDALRQVPLAEWRYEVDESVDRAERAVLPRRYGGQVFAPDVTLRYRIDGFDPEPAAIPQYLTFVRTPNGWTVASDDDFEPSFTTRREIWDLGPVTVVRGRNALVIGRPERVPFLRQLVTATDAAIPLVTRIWGSDWPRKVVVVVPDDETEMKALLGDDEDYSDLAAVAVADRRPWYEPYRAVGNRVIVHRGNFAKLGARGRQIVLVHETTHVATRESSGGAAPVWLIEGFADYVGYRGTGIPVRAIAVDLAGEVRAGRVPAKLPDEESFRGGNPKLGVAYEGSWLAVRLLVNRIGEAGVVKLYRELGAAAEGDDKALSRTLRTMIKTDSAGFVRAWQQYVRDQIG